MKLDPYLTTYTKINLKLIKCLNAMDKTIKLSEESKGLNLHNIRFSNRFLDTMLKHKQQRKNRQIRLHQNFKLLCFRGHDPTNEMPNNNKKYLQIIIHLMRNLFLEYIKNSYKCKWKSKLQ